jgi:hypothetical protein
MLLTHVTWIRDHQHRPVLELCIDGHPAHISSSQRSEHLRRGLVKGVDFLASEWRDQLKHPFIRGALTPGLSERDLWGCTDDPRVFALYQEMCYAIANATWRPGPRPLPWLNRRPNRAEPASPNRHGK